MTPIYKKTFDSPVLTELNKLTKEWMRLKSIDLTHTEMAELLDIFNDPEYIKGERFDIGHQHLSYCKVFITIQGQNGITYINNIKYKELVDDKLPWYKKLVSI